MCACLYMVSHHSAAAPEHWQVANLRRRPLKHSPRLLKVTPCLPRQMDVMAAGLRQPQGYMRGISPSHPVNRHRLLQAHRLLVLQLVFSAVKWHKAAASSAQRHQHHTHMMSHKSVPTSSMFLNTLNTSSGPSHTQHMMYTWVYCRPADTTPADSLNAHECEIIVRTALLSIWPQQIVTTICTINTQPVPTPPPPPLPPCPRQLLSKLS